MARTAKPEAPVTQGELASFVADDSDFAFEMQVLAKLRALGFVCAHSGTYPDPVTGKVRQFDIRAWKDHGASTLALAVECKNLRRSRPLLISAVPRTQGEAFHNVAVFERVQAFRAPSIRHMRGELSIYKPDEMVGKKTDQIGRDSSGDFVSDDQVTFYKLNQAINSCQYLVQRFVRKDSSPLVRAIVPVLAVPSGLLWQVNYSADGALQTPPRLVSRATLFVNHGWSVDTGTFGSVAYCLSHIEFVTLNALDNVVGTWLGNEGFFPPGAMGLT